MTSQFDEVLDDQPQPLMEHLIELRQRLVYCCIGFLLVFSICYYFSESIFSFLIEPLAELLKQKGHDRRMIYTGLAEAFLTYIKVGAFAAAAICFPLFATQIWRFISPALYRHEKKIFISLSLATPLMFFLGAAFAYYIIFPSAYAFFLSFETPGVGGTLPIQLEAKVSEYLSLVMRMILAFGVSFEMPILMMVLAYTGSISSKALIAKWRIAVVAISALAAVITPPDVLSMLGLAIPLVLLYGLSIVLVRWMEKRQQNGLKKDA